MKRRYLGDKMRFSKACGFAVLLWCVSAGVQSASFQVGDALTVTPLIVDFESMGAGFFPTSTYTQNGITVNEIDGDIHTALVLLGVSTRSWATTRQFDCGSVCYAAGNEGYAEITRQDGGDFFNVSLMLGSGLFDSSYPLSLDYWFELYDDDVKVGDSYKHSSLDQGFWFSVLGGGFDEIRLSAYDPNWLASGDDKKYNYLVVDNIKVSNIPLPATIWLLFSGMAGFFASKSFNRRSIDRLA